MNRKEIVSDEITDRVRGCDTGFLIIGLVQVRSLGLFSISGKFQTSLSSGRFFLVLLLILKFKCHSALERNMRDKKSCSVVSAGLFCICIASMIIGMGCTNETGSEKSKKHSQWVMDHIYQDTVFTYLKSRYFSEEEIRTLIQQFREQYPSGTLQGGLKNEMYRRNLTSNDEVAYMYEYKAAEKAVRLHVTYELLQDTFEVKTMVIQNFASPSES